MTRYLMILFLLLISPGLLELCRAEDFSPDIADIPMPGGLTQRKDFREEKADFREHSNLIAKKVLRAKLLKKVNRYQECIDLCDEILIVDKTNATARKLRREAVEELAHHEDANIEVEREVRDRAVMTEASRMGTVPRRLPDLPRPDRMQVPFTRNKEAMQDVREALNSMIPSINLIDTDVEYVLQLLFNTHNINIIYPSEAVAGKKINIQARNITLSSILEYLSSSQGLHYTIKDGIVWMYAEGVDGGGSLFQPEIIPLKTGLILSAGGETVEGENVASDIEAMMEWMAGNWPGWPEESTWTLDYKTNSLIISSTPNIIDDVRKVVEMLDVPPVQVLITSIFVTINEKDYDQLGVNWSMSGNPQRNLPSNDLYGSHGFHDKITLDNIANAAAISTGVTPAAPGEALGLNLTGVLSEHQFNITLSALKALESGKIMSAPRVIALNNHEGFITKEKTFRYASDWEAVSGGVSTDNSAATSTTILPSAYEDGVENYKLVVRPSVGRDMRTISLQIKPTITKLDGWSQETRIISTDAGTGAETTESEQFTLQTPIFATDTIEVEVIINDGETVVIGGLFRDNITDNVKKVPVLGNMPWFGHLFRTKDNYRDRSCDLIFVTAHILTPDNRHYTDAVHVEAEDDDGELIDFSTVNAWLNDPEESI
ncbi:MAG: hypothetical protein JXA52_01980 [Planctomycetes bacterium]|nr:hypothetical protein [Planctomycetota bacterium]